MAIHSMPISWQYPRLLRDRSPSRHLPVILFVEITDCYRIGKDLVEALDARLTNVLAEGIGQFDDVAECLNLSCALSGFGLGEIRLIPEPRSGMFCRSF